MIHLKNTYLFKIFNNIKRNNINNIKRLKILLNYILKSIIDILTIKNISQKKRRKSYPNHAE